MTQIAIIPTKLPEKPGHSNAGRNIFTGGRWEEASPAKFQRRYCTRLRIDGFPICEELHCRGPGQSRHREPGIHSSLLHCGIVTKPGHSAGRPGRGFWWFDSEVLWHRLMYLNEYSEKLSAESRKNRMIKQCSLVRQTWHSEQARKMFA